MYICFHSNKVPFVSSKYVANCNCIKTDLNNFQNIYLFYRNKYLEELNNVNLFLKISAYDSYHNVAAYGLTRMSKRAFFNSVPQIYEFRKSI